MSSFKQALNIADLRSLARRRLPRSLFEYIEGGCEDGLLIEANRHAFSQMTLTPRVLAAAAQRSTQVDLLGEQLDLPLILAPTAVAGLTWFDGEVALARAAAKAGVPFVVATSSLTSIEKVAPAAQGRLWVQLYLWNRRDLAYRLLDRARACGVETLVFTVDTPVDPNREYNRRNGFGIPIKPSLRMAIDLMLHPRWLYGVLMKSARTNGVPRFDNYPDPYRLPVTSHGLPPDLTRQDEIGWDDLRELRRRWQGRLVVKGILFPADARRAVDYGADAIVISNHGGRNFDSAPAALTALPAVVEAVGTRTTVLFDSGIRRGSDIAKALSLGAHAVLVGRAPLYGAAAGGEAGVTHALNILRAELLGVMAALGCHTIAELRETNSGAG